MVVSQQTAKISSAESGRANAARATAPAAAGPAEEHERQRERRAPRTSRPAASLRTDSGASAARRRSGRPTPTPRISAPPASRRRSARSACAGPSTSNAPDEGGVQDRELERRSTRATSESGSLPAFGELAEEVRRSLADDRAARRMSRREHARRARTRGVDRDRPARARRRRRARRRGPLRTRSLLFSASRSRRSPAGSGRSGTVCGTIPCDAGKKNADDDSVQGRKRSACQSSAAR